MWLRLYTELLNDPKIAKLSDDLFRAYILTLCAAKEHGEGGRLPAEDMPFFLRTSPERWADIESGLVRNRLLTIEGKEVVINGWQKRQYESDDSAPRVKRLREKNRPLHVTPDDRYMKRQDAVTCNAQPPLHVTPPETETEQSRTDIPPTPLAGGKPTPADSDTRINSLADAYPTTAGKQQGIRAICELVSESANPEKALLGLEAHWPAWCQFLGERDAQYRPRLDRFVRSNDWMNPPPEQTRKGKAAERPPKPEALWDLSDGVDASSLGMSAEEFAAKLAADLGGGKPS